MLIQFKSKTTYLAGNKFLLKNFLLMRHICLLSNTNIAANQATQGSATKCKQKKQKMFLFQSNNIVYEFTLLIQQYSITSIQDTW